jgi:hypothetical protein
MNECCVPNICFKHKLKTLQFQRSISQRPANTDALKNTFGDAKENMEYARELTDGVGWLRRDSRGNFYKKNHKEGSWEEVKKEEDLNRVLFGQAKVVD